MSQRKKKIVEAHDCLVKSLHIHEAQKAVVQHGRCEMLERTARVEPELAEFIAAAAKDITANAFMDSRMERPVAETLRLRIAALAVSVYTSYYLAVSDLYEDVMDVGPAPAKSPEPETPTTDAGEANGEPQ